MSRPTGNVLAIGGAAVALASLFLKYFDGAGFNSTYWQLFRRWDIVTAAMCVAVIALAVVSLGRAAYATAIWLLLLSGALVGNLCFYVVEHNPGVAAGAWVGAAGSIIAAIGALAVARTDLTVRAEPASAFGTASSSYSGLPTGD
jgi:hypothetical protein